MLIMFLMFPRYSGPLWGLPKDALAGLSGIDDEMSPGSISQLILSDEVAFRVEFNGPVPDKSALYWRGPVLWYTDGFKWVPDQPRRYTIGMETRSEPVRYSVTLEATDKNWLYALDMPLEPTADSYLSHDLQLRTRRSVTVRTRYEVSSYPDYVLKSGGDEELQNALQLPASYHPQAIALAQSWRARGLSDSEIVDQAMRYFNEQNFYYTLTPPPLANDTIDEFLFVTRQGFCEHYAAAFTVLMRGAGIPARVVTGYQGGTVNPVGNYLVVNQRDAHAWTEVWLGEDRGWVRVDPTSAVSPSRVTDGIQSALPQSLINVPLGLYNNTLARSVWERLNNTFDAINNRWNQWVLGYDRNRQRQLLGEVGLGGLNRQQLMTGMIIVVVICLAITGLVLFRRAGNKRDEGRYWYDRFLARLAGIGVQIDASEGPADFARRAVTLRSDLADSIWSITDSYIDTRYANRPDRLVDLKLQVRAFRPNRRRTIQSGPTTTSPTS
jgi:transglutaminase-like putative cysteine protease